MSFDVKKVNQLLKSEEFVAKLKLDLSNEGIIKSFNEEGVKLDAKDAEDFKKILSELNKKLSKKELDNDLLSAAGGISVTDGLRHVGKGIGAAARGVVNVGEGLAHTAWGVVELPISLAKDVGVGLAEGITGRNFHKN